VPDFVQFMHPGNEHGSDGPGFKRWNGLHRRKFLRVEGGYVETPGGVSRSCEVVFWGEWEPESTVQRIPAPEPDGPHWLHRPYYVKPQTYWPDGGTDPLQNTDPFVFGDRFRYTLCRQWRSATNRPSLLRDLEPGSLILFGSYKAGEFVLDTAFVTDEGIRHDHDSWSAVLTDLSEAYVDVTMRATYAWGPGAELRLYSGATRQQPTNGMFSFAPCLPADIGAQGFARPSIGLDGLITPNLKMGFKSTRGLSARDVQQLWERVTEQVVRQDLALGPRFAMPQKHDGYSTRSGPRTTTE
jgi:hypothetical protein